MARKELKPELQDLCKTLTNHRSEIAALKREVKALATLLKMTQRQVKTVEAPTEAVKATTPKQTHFKAELLLEKRSALGLTQKDMAKLLGASALSVYKWESGQVQPRAAQLERIAEVLRMGKRAALAKLGEH